MGCTIVTIERPSPDRLSAGPYIYVRSTCTRIRVLQSLSYCIEAMILFRTALPKTAPSLVSAQVLANHGAPGANLLIYTIGDNAQLSFSIMFNQIVTDNLAAVVRSHGVVLVAEFRRCFIAPFGSLDERYLSRTGAVCPMLLLMLTITPLTTPTTRGDGMPAGARVLRLRTGQRSGGS